MIDVSIEMYSKRLSGRLPAAQRPGVQTARHSPPTIAEVPNVDARRLPRTDWSPLEGRDQSARALDHPTTSDLLVEALVVV